MTGDVQQPDAQATASSPTAATSQSIDWYSEGQSRTVDVAGVRIVVRFVGRKGRRGRIAIEAPAGAVFTAGDDSQDGRRTPPA
jgi:hypothetical protein